MYIIDLLSREITHQFDEHRKRVLCIGWSVDDQDIMTSANDKRLNILNLSNLELKNQIKSPSGKPILHLKYGKKGEKITIILIKNLYKNNINLF